MIVRHLNMVNSNGTLLLTLRNDIDQDKLSKKIIERVGIANARSYRASSYVGDSKLRSGTITGTGHLPRKHQTQD